MRKLKSKHLDNCMQTVLSNCKDIDDKWCNSQFIEYAKIPHNKNCLYTLQSKGYLNVLDNDFAIYGVMLTEYGLNYFIEKEEKKNDFIKDFFSQFVTGFLSGVLSGTLITLLSTWLVNHIQNGN